MKLKLEKIFAILFAIFCVASIATVDATSRDRIPLAEPDDVIEISYLAGVISFLSDWEKLMAKMHVYHGAVGARNLNTGENYTFEYYVDIPNEVDVVFPVVKNPGPQCTVEWQNEGIAWVNNSIDESVFGEAVGGIEVKLAEINGDQYNAFVDWTFAYNKTRGKYYNLWNVVGGGEEKVFIPQLTCWDYVSDAFIFLYDKFGVQFANETVNEAYVDMIVHEKPQIADNTDPTVHKQICEFYDTFQFKGESIWRIIAEIIAFGPENKFVYDGYNYYGPLDFKWPWVSIKWQPIKLPGV